MNTAIKNNNPTKKPTWIVFDVGAVLLDFPLSAQKLASILHVEEHDLLAALYKQGKKMNVGLLSREDGWALVLDELKVDSITPQRAIEIWTHNDNWLTNTIELAKDLKISGYNLAILSNSWLGLTDPQRRKELPDFLGIFDKIIDSSQIGLKKPDPKFFEFFENLVNAKDKELYLIDDDQRNINQAAIRGWRYFHYKLSPDKGAASNAEIRRQLLY